MPSNSYKFRPKEIYGHGLSLMLISSVNVLKMKLKWHRFDKI